MGPHARCPGCAMPAHPDCTCPASTCEVLPLRASDTCQHLRGQHLAGAGRAYEPMGLAHLGHRSLGPYDSDTRQARSRDHCPGPRQPGKFGPSLYFSHPAQPPLGSLAAVSYPEHSPDSVTCSIRMSAPRLGSIRPSGRWPSSMIARDNLSRVSTHARIPRPAQPRQLSARVCRRHCLPIYPSRNICCNSSQTVNA
jgi:hypothetical protein